MGGTGVKMKPGGPLSDADYAALNKALQACENIMFEIQRAGAAGFDCAAENQQCQQCVEALKRIKAAYFPERP